MVEDSIGHVSPAELPRLTRRPPGRSAPAAAAAGAPNSGSSTRSTGPSAAPANRRPSSATSAVSRATTASAPARRARSRPSADRAPATTRRAPRRPGEADGGLPDHAARAENHDLLAGGQLAAPGQRHVGGDGRQPERGQRRGVGPVRQRDERRLRHGRGLGHAPVAGRHPGRAREPHRPAAGDPDALDARHVRCRGPSEVGRPGRAQQVQRRDRRGEDVDEHLAVPRHGRLAVRHHRRAARLPDLGGAHPLGSRHRLRSRCRGR
ncbi:hypothetical protein LUX39_09420 [Actinomadura madurae]|nr:hypothetical protein [Actinomadura madurae]MCQ0013978.1 hypothetical protein [Actinomadura madurae]